jgi:hypothetical protein
VSNERPSSGLCRLIERSSLLITAPASADAHASKLQGKSLRAFVGF